MGWFWADTATPPRPLAPHPLHSSDAAPPVSYTWTWLQETWLTAQAWMPHAQSPLDLSIPSPKLATVASRRLLMPCRLSQRAPLVFHAPTVDSLEIKPSELYAVKSVPIPLHQSDNCSPHLPRHIIHSPRRCRSELGISFPATNVQCHATERLR